MIDRHYIPLFVFATCLALGLALAYFTNSWPTALAIALSGCALALAMRTPDAENHDAAFFEEDLSEIRTASKTQGEDIAVLRSSINELAGIVESLATDMQTMPNQSSAAEVAKLQSAVDVIGKRVSALDAPQQQIAGRVDALEQTVTSLRSEHLQDEAVPELRSVEPVAIAATGTAGAVGAASVASASSAGGSITERAGRLRERFSRPRHSSRKISALPIFDSSRTPLSLLIDDPNDDASVEGSITAIQHALSLIGASEPPGSRIFVRVSPDVIGDPAFAMALEPVLEKAGDTIDRLVVQIPQSTIQGGAPQALEMLLRDGARFCLERMSDWSADLPGLAKRGLAVITVDGPAMAKSALSQKGDPTRLRQVLHAQGIELLASEIETRMQLDAVNTLVPDMIAGPGLGEATLMDASA